MIARRKPKRVVAGQAQDRLLQIASIIETVENRCMVVVDGPVTPTNKEITNDELIAIYELAKPGQIAKNLKEAAKKAVESVVRHPVEDVTPIGFRVCSCSGSCKGPFYGSRCKLNKTSSL